MLNNLCSFLIVDVESFEDRLDIIISSTTRLCSLKNSLSHDFFTAFKVNDKWSIDFSTHQFVPIREILIIPGKPINEELAILKANFDHSLFE